MCGLVREVDGLRWTAGGEVEDDLVASEDDLNYVGTGYSQLGERVRERERERGREGGREGERVNTLIKRFPTLCVV